MSIKQFILILMITGIFTTITTLIVLRVYDRAMDPLQIQYHSQVGAERAIHECIAKNDCLTVDE